MPRCAWSARARTATSSAPRKGVADVLVSIHGRAAHSGVEPERGINAAVEAARLLLDLQALLGRPSPGSR